MYYAVAKGRTTGIFTTWDEAKREVTGYKGAVFKKFKTLEEAKAFLAAEGDEQKIERAILPGELHAYVDGSYAESGTYSYGAVLLTTDGAREFSEAFYDEDGAVRNVAGELRGALFALEEAEREDYKKLVLYYDYLGIEMWATRKWRANLPITQAYRDRMTNASIPVEFVKVPAHSGILYNERADALAKKAIEAFELSKAKEIPIESKEDFHAQGI